MLVGMPSIPAGPNPFAMIAQAWSEYEGHKFKKRVEEFITAIHARLTSVEALQGNHLTRLLDLEDQAALLEESVAATAKEPSSEKREAFARFYVSAVTGTLGDDSDVVRSLLQQLDLLTPSDLKVLRKFEPKGYSTGDRLTDTEMAPASGHPLIEATNDAQEQFLAPLKLSVIKLENRGLILKTLRVDGGGFLDDSRRTPLSEFRREYWQLTYLGRQLLQAISQN